MTAGLVASQGRPGGNVTGLSTPLLAGKQLQVLKESVPALARVAVLYNVGILDPARVRPQYDAAASGSRISSRAFSPMIRRRWNCWCTRLCLP